MSPILVACAAAFGGACAAFVPRVAHRLAVPRRTPPRSACAACGDPLPTWVRAGASCRCRRPPVWTVAAGALAAALLAVALGPSAPLLVLLPASVLGVLLGAVDLGCRRLPDALVATLGAVTMLPLTLGALLAGEPGRVGRALTAAALCGAAYLIVAILPGDGLGLGDVKLATVLGFVLGFAGWPAVLAGLLVPHLLHGPVALALLITRRADRRTALPLGPALLAGAVAGLTLTAV